MISMATAIETGCIILLVMAMIHSDWTNGAILPINGNFSIQNKDIMSIKFAASTEEIQACFPAMRELRPHLDEAGFVTQVQRQMQNHGYSLVYLTNDQGKVAAVAGFRIAEFLAWGKTFYLDDFITCESDRKHGYGGTLLDWLIAHAQALGCQQFHLDSGVQRHEAHRLYLGRKMQITSHHFAKVLA